MRAAVWIGSALAWTVAVGLLLHGSQGQVQLIAWFGGQILLALWVFPRSAASRATLRTYQWESREQAEQRQWAAYNRQQQHLADQARMAYLVNPESQPPPPTDNFPGI